MHRSSRTKILDRKVVLHRGRNLLHGHQHRSFAGDIDDAAKPDARQRHADRGRQPEAHGAGARRTSSSGSVPGSDRIAQPTSECLADFSRDVGVAVFIDRQFELPERAAARQPRQRRAIDGAAAEFGRLRGDRRDRPDAERHDQGRAGFFRQGFLSRSQHGGDGLLRRPRRAARRRELSASRSTPGFPRLPTSPTTRSASST